MSLPTPLDPRFHTEKDINLAEVKFVTDSYFNPTELYPPCETCNEPLYLKRSWNTEKAICGCWFVRCNTQGNCKTRWLKFNRESLTVMKIPPVVFNCLMFPGFPDAESVNLSRIPRMPGFKKATAAPTPVPVPEIPMDE